MLFSFSASSVTPRWRDMSVRITSLKQVQVVFSVPCLLRQASEVILLERYPGLRIETQGGFSSGRLTRNICWQMSWPFQAAITKSHKLGRGWGVRHLFLTVLEAGCPRPKLSMVISWWRPPSTRLHGQWHLPLPRAAGGTSPVVSLIKALIRPWGLWPHHPAASQRNPINGYASAHESGGDTHTHTTVTNRLSFSSICGLEFPCIVYPFIFYDSIFIALFYCFHFLAWVY